MRLVGLTLVAGLLLAGCSDSESPARNSSPSPLPTAPGSSPARAWLCCGSNQVAINTERQIEARATYSDGSIKDVTSLVTSWKSSNPAIASISSTGVVSGLAPGNFEISARLPPEHGTGASWGLYVFQSPYRPPVADEVTGSVRELTGLGPIYLERAEVEVIGGAANGRVVQTISGGLFRINDLRAAGFDLAVRMRGYASARVHVPELGQELTVNLSPAPGVVSDILEGDVCWPNRTISRAFRPAAAGFLRLTAALYAATTRALYADGVLLTERIFNNQDIELNAGVRYELRLTGVCDTSPSMTVHVSFLRPAD
jgi:hypothetical protein